MTRRFAIGVMTVACMLYLAASFAPAGEEILKLVPDGASDY